MTNKQDIRTATAVAHPNIALIKYWGKAPGKGNEPAVSSLSITLDTLQTQTSLVFDASLPEDQLILNGTANIEKLPRIRRNLDTLRKLAGIDSRCRIETENNFPTGAGLASSASGFAALVAAGNQALGLGLDAHAQSKLARSMSGSAARSIFGGFAKIAINQVPAEAAPFGQAAAQAVAPPQHWPLEVCVAIISEAEKAIGSTEGMEHTRFTSPYYSAWLDGNNTDVDDAESLVLKKDFDKLAELSEYSCLKMHALAMAARPGLLYWSGATVDAMHCVRELRAQGIPVFFTVDAGPQLKAICAPGYGARVAEALQSVTGVKRTLRCGLGEGARIVCAE